jgi:hypothetical protein
LVWAAALGWLAADEGNAIHERLERWLGIDWQVLYLPVIVLVAAAWWRVTMRQGRDPAVRMPMVLGAVLWGIALVLEPVQNWGGSPASAAVYDSTMLIEEVAEMLASTAFLIAAVRVLAGRSGGAGSSVSDPPQAV